MNVAGGHAFAGRVSLPDDTTRTGLRCVAAPQAPAHGLAPETEPASERLVDDRDRRRPAHVRLGERPARQQRNAEGPEVVGADLIAATVQSTLPVHGKRDMPVGPMEAIKKDLGLHAAAHSPRGAQSASSNSLHCVVVFRRVVLNSTRTWK